MEEIPNADVVNSRASKNFQISNGESEEYITLGNLYANTKFKHLKKWCFEIYILRSGSFKQGQT